MERISDIWGQWIRQILVDNPTKDVSWEVGLAALPDPATVGQFIGFMVIELIIPGYPITQDDPTPTVVSHRTLLPPFAPREQVEAEVRTLLDELIERRDSPNLGSNPSSNVGAWRPLSPETDIP